MESPAELNAPPVIPEISNVIWHDKYRLRKPDGTPVDADRIATFDRALDGVYKNDSLVEKARARIVLLNNTFLPAGRILAGAGTGLKRTLGNCYVLGTIEDSLASDQGVGIFDTLRDCAVTLQQGGGIGIDLTPLRPAHAEVAGCGSNASGPLSFADVWDAMCRTIMGGGSRRGAMMGTMADWHGDLMLFISAKSDPKRLRMFNLSVMVSDKLMEAVAKDEYWALGFSKRPTYKPEFGIDLFDHTVMTSGVDSIHPVQHEGFWALEGDNGPWYIYAVMKARELWERILHNTYSHAEPGVIFIDRVNKANNLWYCEEIRSTNPCGEQPLPPYGQCALSSINLAMVVEDPFTDNAHINRDKLVEATKVGVRFVDNVLDVSLYPMQEQYDEAQAKRRIGLGITGLANAMQMCGHRYGGAASIEFTESIMRDIRDAAYNASIELAKERGPFPLFERGNYLKSEFVSTLGENTRKGISKHGIRNALLLTVAPVGTGSLFAYNVSSGLEPTFAWNFKRKVLMPDGSHEEHNVEDYGHAKYCEVHSAGGQLNGEGLPDYMVTALELDIQDHIAIQAACQKYVDASISKTINCPEGISFEDFCAVYTRAYGAGLKGCTTYRPNKVTGAVLTVSSGPDAPAEAQPNLPAPIPQKLTRPEVLDAKAYKVKWETGPRSINYYVTLTSWYDETIGRNRPFELFIQTDYAKNRDWINGLCLMVTAVFRRGGDVRFVVKKLEQVHNPTEGRWVNRRYVPSIVAMLGHTIARFMSEIGYLEDGEIIHPTPMPEDVTIQALETGTIRGDNCPMCQQPAYVPESGCHTCKVCGYSDCG